MHLFSISGFGLPFRRQSYVFNDFRCTENTGSSPFQRTKNYSKSLGELGAMIFQRAPCEGFFGSGSIKMSICIGIPIVSWFSWILVGFWMVFRICRVLDCIPRTPHGFQDQSQWYTYKMKNILFFSQVFITFWGQFIFKNQWISNENHYRGGVKYMIYTENPLVLLKIISLRKLWKPDRKIKDFLFYNYVYHRDWSWRP